MSYHSFLPKTIEEQIDEHKAKLKGLFLTVFCHGIEKYIFQSPQLLSLGAHSFLFMSQ